MTDPAAVPPPRFAVVAPTFNHGRSVGAVLGAVRVALPGVAVVAVNDGSTDDTAVTLQTCGVHVVTHPANRGKAAALRSGFAKAAELGCTHAATIDTDGQHNAADLPAVLAASAANPTALVLGERERGIDGCPRGSRVGRILSNVMVRLESGLIVGDSQCGLRVYPLELTRKLGGRGDRDRRYGFETAVLTRFAWAGLPVVRVPVGCVYKVPGGRVSHFRPVRDSVAGGLMHVGLLHRALLPAVRIGGEKTGTLFGRFVHWMNPMRVWRQVRTDRAARRRFAASLGFGVFIALLPLYGVKTCVCLAVARLLRMEPLAMLASSSAVSAPPVGPLLAVGSIALGSVLLRGEVPDLSLYDPRDHGMLGVLRVVAAEWAVGGLILGTLLGLLAYGVAKAFLVRRAT